MLTSLCGFLLIDKPSGPSSHEVVGWVRWALGERRVGHCGTLDPAATGLLVVCVGAATRLSDACSAADKTYRARFLLGRSTTTADLEGETLAQHVCTSADGARALEQLRRLSGPLMLPPPRFSAVHVDGRRAHELARAGESFSVPPRPMAVHQLQDAVVEEAPGEIAVSATLTVSKGTYIRSLAEALGARIQLPVCLAALRRTRSGAWGLDDERVVGPVDAMQLPSPVGQKPRYRLRCAGVGHDRQAQREVLERALVPPTDGLPFPVVALREGAAASAAVRQLSYGQPTAVRDELLARGLPELASGTTVAVDGGGALFLGRWVEAADDGPAFIHPQRLIIAPPESGGALDNPVRDEDSPPDKESIR